jgi:hypothetical protein
MEIFNSSKYVNYSTAFVNWYNSWTEGRSGHDKSENVKNEWKQGRIESEWRKRKRRRKEQEEGKGNEREVMLTNN